MIIHQPEICTRDGETSLSARVEMRRAAAHLPPELWFAFPEKHAGLLRERGDPFAASLLLIAMYFGEALEVRGAVSPRLAYGLQEYQRIFHLWFPRQLSLIDLKIDKLEALRAEGVEGAVASAFSGGVDSFFALWSHLPQNQPIPSAQLSHSLFIHGFNIPFHDRQNYDLANQKYAAMFRRLGLELIPARTNLRQFTESRINIVYTHGAILVGPALALGGLLRRYYIPSSFHYLTLRPWGSSALTDHLLSTETLEVVHHGAAFRRIQKTGAIAGWPEAQNHLRVCIDYPKFRGVQNCSRCEKCLRTMTMLKVLGELPNFTTFRQPLRWRDLLRWGLIYEVEAIGVPQTVRHIWKTGKQRGLIPLLLLVNFLGWIRHLILTYMPKRLKRRLKQMVFPLEKNPYYYSGEEKRS